MDIGKVIWITGLSGAGKTSLASELTARLSSQGRAVVRLDGDELREIFGVSTASRPEDYGRDSRLALARRYGLLCNLIASQGFTVVIATISLFHEVHAWNRDNLPGYFEVYLKVPTEELRRRDPKGIYRRFDAGELTGVTGLDIAFEEPLSPDWVAEFSPGTTAKDLSEELLDILMWKAPA